MLAVVHTQPQRSNRMFGGSHHHEPISPTRPASAIIGDTPPPAIIARYANATIRYVAALCATAKRTSRRLRCKRKRKRRRRPSSTAGRPQDRMLALPATELHIVRDGGTRHRV